MTKFNLAYHFTFRFTFLISDPNSKGYLHLKANGLSIFTSLRLARLTRILSSIPGSGFSWRFPFFLTLALVVAYFWSVSYGEVRRGSSTLRVRDQYNPSIRLLVPSFHLFLLLRQLEDDEEEGNAKQGAVSHPPQIY